MNETPPILSQSTNPFETSSSPPRTRRRINIQNSSSDIETAPPVASVPRIQEENALEEEFQQIIDDLNELDLVDADGGDSDIEGEECEIFDTSYAFSVMERANNEESEVHVKERNNGGIAFVLANKGVIREEDENINFEDMVKLLVRQITKLLYLWVVLHYLRLYLIFGASAVISDCCDVSVT